jgi:uncharacterized protein YkwD
MAGRRIPGALAAAVAVAAIGACAVTTAAAPAATGSVRAPAAERIATLEQGVLAAVNDVRRAHHLEPLKQSARLDRAAADHSREMGQAGFFSHDSADGSEFWKRVQTFYPSKSWSYWSVGENLLWASPDIDAAGAVKLWMESPEHRANLLAGRWREIGLSALRVPAAPGAFHGLDVTIVTADFGVRR